MTVRMDNQQKIEFDRLCEQFGMSANTAINIFVKAVIRSKSIPFSIKAKEEDEVTRKAREAFKRLRAAAERGETPDLTLDEINAEIREVRRLKKNAMPDEDDRVFYEVALSEEDSFLVTGNLKACSINSTHC